MGELCGIPLKAFGVIVGWLSVMVAVFNCFLLCMALHKYEDVVVTMQALFNVSAADGDRFKCLFFIGLYVLLALIVTVGIASGLLVFGVYKRRHQYMIFFLVIMAIIIVLLVSGLCVRLAMTSSIGIIFLHIWFLILMCLISGPIWLLYREIRNENISRPAA